jgi:hypothetical protein
MKYKLRDGTPVEILGNGPLTSRFKNVQPVDEEPYLVWADTMRYRLDKKDHPKDVIEV